MVRFTKENEVKIVKNLRFRLNIPSKSTKTFMRLNIKAKFINMSNFTFILDKNEQTIKIFWENSINL